MDGNAPHPGSGQESGRGRILVMDDERVIRETLREMLELMGYEATATRDGSEAVACYAEALQAGRPFDAVVLDLTVPTGMGGRETIIRLRQLDPAVKGLATSGYVGDDDQDEILALGFRSVLAKPYRISDITEALQKLLQAPG